MFYIEKLLSSPHQRNKVCGYFSFVSCKNLMLILNVSTRWNSTYYMVEKAIKVQIGFKNWLCITIPIGSIKLDELQFSDDEWQRFQSICDHLKMFEEDSRLMSREKYPTLFFVMSVFVEVFSCIKGHVSILDDLNPKENAMFFAHQVLFYSIHSRMNHIL